jgi:uncharacterized protein (DUF2164 family)
MSRKERAPIELSDDVSRAAVGSLQRYFSEELDEELSQLKAQLFLEFIVKEIGPSIYNAAIADAQAFMRDRAADLEGALFAPEFAYWQKPSVRRGPSR